MQIKAIVDEEGSNDLEIDKTERERGGEKKGNKEKREQFIGKGRKRKWKRKGGNEEILLF